MDTSKPYFFDDQPVLAHMPRAAADAKLLEYGYDIGGSNAGDPEGVHQPFRVFSREPRPYDHGAHVFGFISPTEPNHTESIPIHAASTITPDVSLKKQRVTIKLDHMHIAEYPGGGIHQVLFDFYGENHIGEDQVERVHFNQVFRGHKDDSVGVVGYPIFVGMNVGSTGIAFRCRTVNVKNEGDEAILAFLSSDEFQGGLKLATTAQPALAPLTSIAVGLTKSLANRHKNVPVQSFYLGLDFSNLSTTAKLAQGSYVAVQVPESDKWDWRDWMYSPGGERIVRAKDDGSPIPYNYVIFSVFRFEA